MSTTIAEVAPQSLTTDVWLPEGAPVFLCPACQCRLHYKGSRSTTSDDESAPDLIDAYVCPAGCGDYEYTRRAHRLRGTSP